MRVQLVDLGIARFIAWRVNHGGAAIPFVLDGDSGLHALRHPFVGTNDDGGIKNRISRVFASPDAFGHLIRRAERVGMGFPARDAISQGQCDRASVGSHRCNQAPGGTPGGAGSTTPGAVTFNPEPSRRSMVYRPW